ncbi:DUF6624 domain-containing protein [Streptomyces sp. NPDC004732]|uniref:DUF6624 domain-containing protein n=1 Tax=Streptomyces sp. NPDC004732 TaxID=3154290 RepID=UPI0033A0B52A
MSITIDAGADSLTELFLVPDAEDRPLDQLARGIDARRKRSELLMVEAAFPAGDGASTAEYGVERADIAHDLCRRAEAAQERWAERLPRVQGVPDSLPHELLDASNTRALHRIVAVHGWPGSQLVGVEGGEAALCIALRISGDEPTAVPFVHTLLQLLGRAAERSDVPWAHWAQLYDRLCVLQGVPQAYGTQYLSGPGRGGMYPVADPAGLDERRADLGLPPALGAAANAIHVAGSSEEPRRRSE